MSDLFDKVTRQQIKTTLENAIFYLDCVSKDFRHVIELLEKIEVSERSALLEAARKSDKTILKD